MLFFILRLSLTGALRSPLMADWTSKNVLSINQSICLPVSVFSTWWPLWDPRQRALNSLRGLNTK